MPHLQTNWWGRLGLGYEPFLIKIKIKVAVHDENDEDTDEEPVHVDFDELNITDMKSAKKALKIGKKTYY